MFSVLLCGLAGLLVALYSASRPSEARIQLAERLAKAVVFFSVAGLASNLAQVFVTVGEFEHVGDSFRIMLLVGLYESTAPLIMGLTFVALIHVGLAIAAFRLARQEL